MPEIPKGFYIKKNGKRVRRITLAQVQIEFQKKPFQKTPKDIETIKKLLVEYAKMNLPPNEQRKMIACVKNVKTKKDLEEAIELAGKYAEQHYKRTSGKKKQNKKTTPPEPLSKKEIEEQISGIMKHPAFEFFADDKKFKEICFGDVERPTEFDEFIVQESDNAEIVVKSQIALLAKESDYITMQLERWKNEKIKEGDVIAEWYKRAERPFTCRLLKAIHTSCECIESILAMRREMSHLRIDFETGYERLVEVAGKCDIERAKWFRVLPVKPINDFRSATEEFQRIVLMIYSEAKIELDRLTKPASSDKAGETDLAGKPAGKKITGFIPNEIESALKIAENLDKIADDGISYKKLTLSGDVLLQCCNRVVEALGNLNSVVLPYLEKHKPDIYKFVKENRKLLLEDMGEVKEIADHGNKMQWPDKVQSRLRNLAKALRACSDNAVETKTGLEVEPEFVIEDSRILYNGVDLNLPTGEVVSLAKMLIENTGNIVPYTKLDKHSLAHEASDNLRKYKSIFKKKLKTLEIPYEITTKKRNDYILSRSQTIHKESR